MHKFSTCSVSWMDLRFGDLRHIVSEKRSLFANFIVNWKPHPIICYQVFSVEDLANLKKLKSRATPYVLSRGGV